MFKKFFGFGKKDKEEKRVDEINEELEELIEDLDGEIEEDFERISEEEILKELESVNSNDEDTQIETVLELEEIEKPKKSEPKEEKKGFFAKIREGLAKTKESFTEQFNNVFHLYKKIDDEFLDEIEEILISADMGVELTMDIIDYIKEEVKKNKLEDPNEIKGVIKRYLVDMLKSTKGVEDIAEKQKIIMIVGVNGVGKTTSIGKLSYRLKSSGKSVIVAAGDTFRAAAIEQLEEWCNRAKVDIVASEQGSDPGSIVYDAIQAARARKTDVLICDTAGRLHNKVNLMNELTKIFKIIEKEYSSAQKEVLLVIDANTGQNGLIQAKLFKQSCSIDGIILTKLDSTAKGGIVFPIVKELNVPIKYIGVGEKIDDLQVFDAEMFVDAIFE
ncbi:MAG TPA: signal recognition particle-docking protein FtsY [Clostridiales bacterium]|nr:signal recognition particle-docking protein FtsY [Clostridiales bacterium]